MCDVKNIASQHVADKAGFTFEGVSRSIGWYVHAADLAGHPHDARVYSMTLDDLDG